MSELRESVEVTALPSRAVIVSPAVIPVLATAEPFSTCCTTTPVSLAPRNDELGTTATPRAAFAPM